MNISDLDAFIDESIRIGRQHNYHPTTFERMRERHGTKEAIERLVVNGEIQTGFRRLVDLGLSEWTIEEAVRRFPEDFKPSTLECANFRLGLVGR